MKLDGIDLIGGEITDNIIGNAELKSEVSTGSGSAQNYIINGNFNIWQRGTSFTAAIEYTTDRFEKQAVGSHGSTVTRSTLVPTLAESNTKSNYSLRTDITTAQPSLGINDYLIHFHAIEGYDYVNIDGKTVTLSFWVKATKTGINSVIFKNAGNDRSYVSEYTINTTNTWEKKTVTVLLNDSANGTWDFTNGRGLDVIFGLGSGSTYTTSTLDTWQTGNFLASTNQVNHADSTANDFAIAQVQLEVGSSATDFSEPSITETISKCQRYYCKSFEIDVTPVTNIGSFNGTLGMMANSNGSFNKSFKYPVRMRTTPTLTRYNPGANNSNWRRHDFGADATSFGSFPGEEYFYINMGGGTGNNGYGIHFTAEAEL